MTLTLSRNHETQVACRVKIFITVAGMCEALIHRTILG